ncbi:MAG: flavin reductase family protein [Candidatus Nanopelagicales bacterium]
MPTTASVKPPTATPISGAELRAAASHFPTGVAIVSTLSEIAEPVGCTISSFLSVSLAPPIVAVSLSRQSSTAAQVITRGNFGISVLSSTQRGIAHVFASRDVDHDQRFAGVHWRAGASGVPLLENALSSLDCDVQEVVPAGDHYLVLGAVTSLFAAGWGTPLVHHQGTMGSLHR